MSLPWIKINNVNKSLFFCLLHGKVKRSKSLHELKKNIYLSREKAENSGLPHEIFLIFLFQMRIICGKKEEEINFAFK